MTRDHSDLVEYRRVPLVFERQVPGSMTERAREFADAMVHRRSVREFSTVPFPEEILVEAIRAAASSHRSGITTQHRHEAGVIIDGGR